MTIVQIPDNNFQIRAEHKDAECIVRANKANATLELHDGAHYWQLVHDSPTNSLTLKFDGEERLKLGCNGEVTICGKVSFADDVTFKGKMIYENAPDVTDPDRALNISKTTGLIGIEG